jgi:hypothetical protein
MDLPVHKLRATQAYRKCSDLALEPLFDSINMN